MMKSTSLIVSRALGHSLKILVSLAIEIGIAPILLINSKLKYTTNHFRILIIKSAKYATNKGTYLLHIAHEQSWQWNFKSP